MISFCLLAHAAVYAAIMKQDIRDLFLIFQIPVMNIQAKIIPALFTLLGAVFSCTNYFRVIFTGGMGKNGSTIAVS